MSSSKNLTCKGTLRQVFIRVYILEIQSVDHVCIFAPALCTVASLTFSLVQLPLPPSLCKSTVYTDSVWLGGGGAKRLDRIEGT
jgi:hypothetical protein